MSMTKIDIIESVYEHLGISKKDSVTAVESLFEIIKDELGKHAKEKYYDAKREAV
jgi:integration host factor subunit alpha